jgi:hypothetical protein
VPHWLLKAAVQGCISAIPRNYIWNDLFQQHVTKTLRLSASRVRLKIIECREHVATYVKFAPQHAPLTTVLELGTGWYPILPLGFYLCGASKIMTFDIQPLLRVDRVTASVRTLLNLAEAGDLLEMLPWVRLERLDGLRRLLDGRKWPSAEHILRELGIHIHLRDARDTGLEGSFAAFIVSNGTLQHISRVTLVQIFAEFRRVASPNAVMSHRICIADHFAGFDASITPFNYLRYSSAKWRWINNSIISQNRLRLSDYRTLHLQSGFAILQEQNTEGSQADLDSISLSREFQHYSREDLLVIYTRIASRPAKSLETQRDVAATDPVAVSPIRSLRERR